MMIGILKAIEVGGARKLAILVGGLEGKGSQPSGQALSALLRARGSLVRSGRVEQWRVEGSLEEGGSVLVYGPAFEGRSLDELCTVSSGAASSGAELSKALSSLVQVAAALELAAADGTLPSNLISSAILVGDCGEVLILPAEPCLRAFRAQGEAARARAAAFLRSPRAGANRGAAAFLLAQAAYRASSGESAYPLGEAGQESAVGGFLPLAGLCPRLEPGLAAAVDAILAAPEEGGLARLGAALEAAAARGWLRELPAGELAAAARQAESARVRLEAKRRRETFLRKRAGLLIGSGAALALAILGVASYVNTMRGKPNYAALPPAELVRTYYAAVDAMDLDSIEACAERKASKADSDYVSTMTVVSKMRQAYEGKDPIVKAGPWVAAGKPPIDSERALFGLSGLELAPLSEGADTAEYRADYSSWTLEHESAEELAATGANAAVEGAAAPSRPSERRLRDRLYLERRGAKGWRILRIERAERP